MAGDDPDQLIKEFQVTQSLRPDIAKPVWHCSLSFRPGERLSSERWAAHLTEGPIFFRKRDNTDLLARQAEEVRLAEQTELDGQAKEAEDAQRQAELARLKESKPNSRTRDRETKRTRAPFPSLTTQVRPNPGDCLGRPTLGLALLSRSRRQPS